MKFKEKLITSIIVVAMIAILGAATVLYSATIFPSNFKDYIVAIHSSAINNTQFSTVSGAGTAFDLGTPVCTHNVTLYASGSWLTVSAAPGLMIELQGSNDNTNYAVFDTHWWTNSNSANIYQISGNNCYQYLRASWTSAAAAWAWTTASSGRVNVMVTSGGI